MDLMYNILLGGMPYVNLRRIRMVRSGFRTPFGFTPHHYTGEFGLLLKRRFCRFLAGRIGTCKK